MDAFEQGLRRLTGKNTAFESSKPVYFGGVCMIPIGEGCLARLEFDTFGYAGHYTLLIVGIINRNAGKVDQLILHFEHYFQKSYYDYGDGFHYPYILKNKWAGEPTDLDFKRLSDAAYDYIQLFA